MVVNVVSFSFSSGHQFNQGSREPFGRVWLSLLNPSPTGTRTQLYYFCSIRRPYITFKLPRGDMDTPPRLRNFFRYLAIVMCHFRYLWNGLCDRHRAEITVMQFRGHSLPVRQSVKVSWDFFYLVPFHQPISAHAISSHNCHLNVSLPSGASPWMEFLAGSKGQNITNTCNKINVSTNLSLYICVCVCMCVCVCVRACDVLLWTPPHGRASVGRPTKTYLQRLDTDTGCSQEDLPEAMDERHEWRESGKSVLAPRHENDNDVHIYRYFGSFGFFV